MEKTPEQLRSVGREPILYRLAKFMQRTGIRGGHRLERTLLSNGGLDVNVRHRLNDSVQVDVPLSERTYDASYLADYESDSIERMAPIISRYESPFCLLDCGADFGLMSAKFVASVPAITRVISFEPNPVSFLHLEGNARLLGVDVKALNMGVGNFNGKAELRLPDFNDHDHAAFVVPNEDGDFDVTTVDALNLGDDRALFFKIDVEGSELAVLQGARACLERVNHVVVLFEAHPEQARRAGIDPVEVIEYVTSIRECGIMIVELPDETVDTSRPFFDQLPERILNVCLYSTTASPRILAERSGSTSRATAEVD